MGCGLSKKKSAVEPEHITAPPSNVAANKPVTRDTSLDDSLGDLSETGNSAIGSQATRIDRSQFSHRDISSTEVIVISDFPDLTRHHHWLALCLTKKIWDAIRFKSTKSGVNVDTICQTGIDNTGHPLVHTVGCVAGDEESYVTFNELFDPIIENCHAHTKHAIHYSCLNPDDIVGEGVLDPQYVISCRIRTGRNICGYSLPPHCTRAERRDVEFIMTHVLCSFSGEMCGKYYPLSVMSSVEQEKLVQAHLLFEKPVDPRQVCAGIARDWPDARGMWHNHDNTFFIWINEKDHCRIISMQRGGNMMAVFKRLCVGVKTIEEQMHNDGYEFMWNSHLGYIHTCPSNLGTGLRAGVHVKLPNLGQHPNFGEFLQLLRLQKRGAGGVNTEAKDGIFDLSNLSRLGTTEVDQVQQVIDGVAKLIEMEKRLEAGLSIQDLRPSGLNRVRTDFPDLRSHYNLMALHMNPALYDHLHEHSTPSGFTLQRSIQSGIDDPGVEHTLSVGCVAGDEESYIVFKHLFDKVIKSRHASYSKSKLHKTNLDPDYLQVDVELEPYYILGIRIRATRAIRGFTLPPQICRSERRAVEKIIKEALDSLEGGEFSGKYYSMMTISPEEKAQLLKDKLIYDKPKCTWTQSSGILRDWPDARGAWVNDEKTLTVNVNNKDHCRIYSIQKDHDMKEAFRRYCEKMNRFEAALKSQGHEFMYDDHLGYLSTCPHNVGTGMRCEVHMVLQYLSKDKRFDWILKSLGLRREYKEPSSEETQRGEVHILNVEYIGSDEVQQMHLMIDGMYTLIEMEKQHVAQKSLHKLLPANYEESHQWKDLHQIKSTFKMHKPRSSNMPDLTRNSSWMAKVLTKEMHERLKNRVTETGFRFDEVIQTGVDNPGHPYFVTCGCVAGDEESYETFAPLFDRVIEWRHNGYTRNRTHCCDLDWEAVDDDGCLDPKFVISCRIRSSRCIRPLPLPPHCTRRERREVEHIMYTALTKGALDGTYYKLQNMPSKQERELVEEGILFTKPKTGILVVSGLARDWPDGRAMWHNRSKSLMVWINHKDHCRIISVEQGANIKRVFQSFCLGLEAVEISIEKQGFEFMWNDHLGYIVSCPSDLGTGMRASVHIKLPLLGEHNKFGAILEVLRLQKRGQAGEEDVVVQMTGGIYDISNLDRLGSSEVQQVQCVLDGVKLLIQMEKTLMAGETIDDLIPTAAKKLDLPEDSVAQMNQEVMERIEQEAE